MMQWANPVTLWALPLALTPLLLRPPKRTAEPVTMPFAGTQFLRAARPRPRARRWITVVRIAALVFLIVGFARPQWMPPTVSSAPAARGSDEVALVPADNPFLRALLGQRPQHGARGLDFQAVGEVRSGQQRVASAPYFHPALTNVGDLGHVRVFQWVSLSVTGRAVVLLRLRNGDPLLVEEGGWIRSAVALDPAWTDLPFHPQVVPLVHELSRYLRTDAVPVATPAHGGVDLGRFALGLVAALALVEMWLAGHRAWKWLPLICTVWLAWNPTVPGPRTEQGPAVTVVDRTDSMLIFSNLPRGDVEVNGPQTDLGSALLQVTNRPGARVVLYTDGQHNRGPDPAWVVARRAMPVEVAPLAPVAFRDVSIAEVEHPTHAVRGRPVEVAAAVTVVGYDAPVLRVRLGGVVTNVAPGRLELTVAAEPDLAWEVEPLPGEITVANNRRAIPMRVLERPVRVWLSGPTTHWEYRHLRRLMSAHPLVELVPRATEADVLLPATGETWRLRQRGELAHRSYWYQRLAPHLPPALPEPSTELYRLGLNETLRADLARIGAAAQPAEVQRRDLRDSAELLVLLGGLFLAGWATSRVLQSGG